MEMGPYKIKTCIAWFHDYHNPNKVFYLESTENYFIKLFLEMFGGEEENTSTWQSKCLISAEAIPLSLHVFFHKFEK